MIDQVDRSELNPEIVKSPISANLQVDVKKLKAILPEAKIVAEAYLPPDEARPNSSGELVYWYPVDQYAGELNLGILPKRVAEAPDEIKEIMSEEFGKPISEYKKNEGFLFAAEFYQGAYLDKFAHIHVSAEGNIFGVSTYDRTRTDEGDKSLTETYDFRSNTYSKFEEIHNKEGRKTQELGNQRAFISEMPSEVVNNYVKKAIARLTTG